MIKECKHCGVQMKIKRITKQFCSQRCRAANVRAKEKEDQPRCSGNFPEQKKQKQNETHYHKCSQKDVMVAFS